MFSNYEVEYGRDDSGAVTYTRIPIRYGDASRQATSIIQGNSASKLPNAPMMTFHITDLAYERSRVQEPFHVDKKSFKQREWVPASQTYETTQGNAFTVERLMPVPFNLKIDLDIWTTSTTMKLQVLEQILILFNPSMEIQSTDNYIDWTSLSVVELETVNWSSRPIPVGTEHPIDITTLRFVMPIWLSAPAKVKKLGVVHKIIASIFDANGDTNNALLNDDLLLGTRLKVTPFGYQVVLIDNQLQLLKSNEVDITSSPLAASTEQTSNVRWHALVDVYGQLRNGISQIRLSSEYVDTEIVGTLAYHPNDDKFMLFSIDTDTIPANTITAINAVIDPLASGPGSGLIAAASGQRYLLTEGFGDSDNVDPGQAWGSLVAKANDIIQYTNSVWQVVWRATEHRPDQSTHITDFVTNLTTGIQYKWTGVMWVKSYQGIFKGGDWSLVL